MKFLDNNGLEYLAGKIVGLVSGVGSADFIEQEGTDGYWTYRKWASGLVEMWGSKSFTLSITTSWGNGFYYSGGSDSNYILLSYPSGIFINTPICFCQVSSSTGSVMVMPTGLNSGGTVSTPAYHAVRSGSLSNCVVQAEFYVKGLWKAFDSNAMRSATLDTYYPVGSIYMTINNINPANLFGGTWEQIKDKFLLSAGDTYSAGSTGGEATHTLTKNEMPAHGHSLNAYAASSGGGGGGVINYNNNAGGAQYIAYDQGGGQAHNNMPPYLTVYVWKRTA